MTQLVFGPGRWAELRSFLFRETAVETGAALVVAPGSFPGGHRLVVREVIEASEDDYLVRNNAIASLAPSFVAKTLKKARAVDGSLILVHTHPQQTDVAFSPVDDQAQRMIAAALYARAPGPHGLLVVGPHGFSARLFDRAGATSAIIDTIQEVGRSVRTYRKGSPHDAVSFKGSLDRNVRAFGSEGQRLLRKLRVGVVGVGGTGSIVVEELARLAVGSLLLIDPEVLEDTNLNRVLGSAADDVGKPKVNVAAAAAGRARSTVTTETIEGSVFDEDVGRALLSCDFVFCCTDSHGSRAVLNQLAYQYRIPMIDIGVRIDATEGKVTGMSTRVQMLAEGLACLNCHPLLDANAVRRDLMTDPSTDRYIVGSYEPQPAVISLNASTSSAAVSMFLSATVGFPGEARHLVGRPIEGVVRPIASSPMATCIVCGEDYANAKADGWPMIWRRQ